MNRMGRWHLEQTEFPAVRRVMGAGHEQLDDEAIEDRLGQLFPGAEPEYVEDFMRSFQRFTRQAAPLVQRALPGVVQGAVQGAMAGGPWGALAGALGGGAMSLLPGGRAAAPPAPPSPSPSAAPSPGASPVPTAPSPAGTSSPNTAAAQLVALLSRPETMQALLALLMSSSGRRTVSVGTQQVPASAFANAIAETAARVAEACDAGASNAAGYWLDAMGSPRCDVFNPAERASLLLNDLGWAAAAEQSRRDDEGDDEEAFDPEISLDVLPDPLEAYELELEGAFDDD